MILTPAAIVAQASPAPASPSPAASAAADARAWYDALAQGKVVEGDALTDEMKAALTPDALQSLATHMKDFGPPKTFTLAQHENAQNLDVYVFRITYAKANPVNFIYALDARGRVAGLRFVNAQ